MTEVDESEVFRNSKTDKSYISSMFLDVSGRKLRIANKYVCNEKGYEYAIENKEVVLRETPGSKQQIKATFLEDNREFKSVTIQKFIKNGVSKQSFSFGPREISKILEFFANIKRIHFQSNEKINITDVELEELLLRPDQARRLVIDNPKLIAALAREEITSEDIVALGYRKHQLQIFDNLLHDEKYFNEKKAEVAKGPEAVWQDFFQVNPWIFGGALSLIHFGPLNGRKLEQTVKGHSVVGAGKRVDAFLRSNALVSTACFVEIKRHDTLLLSDAAYRLGIWQPSPELSGAVAQVQGTVFEALQELGAKHDITNPNGEPTGETIVTTEPRSFVICGSLNQFRTENGINTKKFQSFERYRRNVFRPEIITFDELYERARLILEAEHPTQAASSTD